MRRRSQKSIETELYVDEHIATFGHPPTYEDIRIHFKLNSSSVAYARCEKFRDKMRSNVKPDVVRVKTDFVVPKGKYAEFSKLLEKINKLLTASSQTEKK